MYYSLEQLYELSQDRPHKTPESHTGNDFYSHARILKKYAGLPDDYIFKMAVEHAPSFAMKNIWCTDLRADLPAMLVCSSHRAKILMERLKRPVFTVGPYIYYEKRHLNEEQLEKEKKRLGKNLLAFPAHSTHWLTCIYDIEEHICQLEKIKRDFDFDTVRVSLGWKDILDGKAEIYLKNGIEVTTAGQMYDPLFLSRLKSNIETATVTTTNLIATPSMYSIALNKPHFILEIPLKVEGPEKELGAVKEFESEYMKKPLAEMHEIFSEVRFDITDRQRQFAEKYVGISEFKTPEQIRDIIQITQDLYNKGKEYYLLPEKSFVDQPCEYIKAGKSELALILLDQTTDYYQETESLEYLKELALSKLNRLEDAKEPCEEIKNEKAILNKGSNYVDINNCNSTFSGPSVNQSVTNTFVEFENLKNSQSYTLSGSLEMVLKTICENLESFPRRVPGKLNLDGRDFYYADLHSFYYQSMQIFADKNYDFESEVDAPVIIDCGAHIGLASIFFASRYPNATIYAFEADPLIAQMCQENIKSFGLSDRIKVSNKAIWTHNDGIQFNASCDDSGYIAGNKTSEGITAPSVRLCDLIQDQPIEYIKLDIEGSEFEVIKDCKDVLSNVNKIIAEVHQLGKMPGASSELLKVLEDNNFSYIFDDLNTAPWVEEFKKPPFPKLNTDKYYFTVYAWRQSKVSKHQDWKDSSVYSNEMQKQIR